MSSLLNRCMFYATSTGTGSFVVASAVPNFLTPAQASATNGATYSYVAEAVAGTEWEIGTGTYTSGTVTLTRTPLLSSNANAAVNFTSVPRVAVTVLAADVIERTSAGTVAFGAGSVSAPSISTVSDSNTGMWYPTADTIAFSTDGSERLRISSAGLTSVTGTFSVSSTSTFTGAITATSTIEINGGLVYIDGNTNPGITIRNASDVSKSLIYWNSSTDALTLTRSGTNDLIQNSSNVWQINGNTVWHAGNDGTGTGLDADLLDGVQLSTIDVRGTQSLWIPYGAMTPTTTNGAATYSTELATNDVMLGGWAFDTSTAENVCFQLALPKQWNEGTVTFRAYWTAASGSGGVAWSLAGMARSDDDAMDNAYGTAQTVTDTLITANDLHVTSVSSAITIGSTPAEGDIQFFKITRAVSDGSDTLAVDAILLGIEMNITTNAATDA